MQFLINSGYDGYLVINTDNMEVIKTISNGHKVEQRYDADTSKYVYSIPKKSKIDISVMTDDSESEMLKLYREFGPGDHNGLTDGDIIEWLRDTLRGVCESELPCVLNEPESKKQAELDF